MTPEAYNESRHYSEAVQGAIAFTMGLHMNTQGGPLNDIEPIKAWQKKHHLAVDGKIGPSAFKALEAQWKQPQHPLPKSRRRWGYDHCPNTYKKPCPVWEQALDGSSAEQILLKMVSGECREPKVYSRSPDSWISLDEFSLGFAHWWSDTAPKLLSRIAIELPQHASWAWGPVCLCMRDENWLRDQIRVKRGARAHQKKYDWLLSGWWEIALHPDVIRLTVDAWLKSYASSGYEIMRSYGWTSKAALVATTRLVNSRGKGGAHSLIRRAVKSANTRNAKKVLEEVYCNSKLYDHPERWDRILKLSSFETDAPKQVSSDSLSFERNPVRSDGSYPNWFVQEEAW